MNLKLFLKSHHLLLLGFLLFSLFCIFTPHLFAEKIELTTYYPSPQGEYDKLKAKYGIIGNYDLQTPPADGTLLVSGRVGIGTPTPMEQLEVKGCITLTADIIGQDAVLHSYFTRDKRYYDLIGLYPGWRQDVIYIAGYNAATTPASGRATRHVSIGGEGTERLWVDLINGRVGIGITGPAAKLDVRSPANDTSSVANSNIYIRGSDQGYGLAIGTRMTYPGGIWMQGMVNDATGAANILLNPNSGNVGIGTTNPYNKLHVYGEGLRISNGAFGANGFVFEQDASSGHLNIRYKVPTEVHSEIMTLGYYGNVGIGTTNPQRKLTIQDNAYSPCLGFKVKDGKGWSLFADNGTEPTPDGAFGIFEYTDTNWTTGNYVLTISKGGYVGIGVTNRNSSKLDVDGGSIRAIYATSSKGDCAIFAETIAQDKDAIIGVTRSGAGKGVYGLATGIGGCGVYGLGGGWSAGKYGVGVYGEAGAYGTKSAGWAGYFKGNVYADGTITATKGCSSDLRLKKNIENMTGVLEKLNNINAVRFDWRTEEFPNLCFPKGKQIGIVAEEVEKEFPELVTTDNEGYKGLFYEKFTAVLLEAIKEQQKEIEYLKKEIKELKTK